ncbi:malto-oligosyltrehalose synthase [Streptomyces pactum]|uniref:Malto-oligosyltrehalose synthase n=1 Tax=Streptomyces pactum TaxID=68249 RepID=A0ABS0NQP9_9ACTN|nr:malto-oligosyltrehalose synthase [Streptomyces pactum]MBH5337522.1 malto-oligosyltrehalose synthase [Streptomyces pactum]
MTPDRPAAAPAGRAPHTAGPDPAGRGARRDGPPTATYRLQLQPGFPFAAAREAVPYLAALGVSHLHLSPVLEAVPGSTHGYDVVDHAAVRGELGGEEGLRELAAAAHAHGLGLVVDVVPNHMALPAPERLNRPLWEVLRDGPSSRYARWFDIDWTRHGGRVLLPVLGGPLGEELKHLTVAGDTLRYHDHVLPLRPGTRELPLPELLRAQWYRLGWWRLARTELNYRRFFTISELIAVRVEDPEVFGATHAKLLELVADGVIDGLRVDHPDGLADPGGYLRRLARATGGRWTVVEKILAPDETLPAGWPVAGTTGYDALHRLDGLFVDSRGLAVLDRAHRSFTGLAEDLGGTWPATVRRSARQVVSRDLAAEVERLVRCAERICEAAPRPPDHAPWALRTAVRELLVRLPVYRPYTAAGRPADPGDAALLRAAAEGARAAFTVREEARAVDTVRDAALGRLGDGPAQREFCARFAQTAAALRAKSVEDSAFYRHTPLLSAAEVGGDPGGPAVTVDGFHAYCARTARHHPLTGTVLTTHDTKRSADVRARLAVLTELPDRWARVLDEVVRAAGEAGAVAPDAQLAWVAWQTALGLGPAETVPERLVPAVLKAVREAGVRTTWTEPDTEYEDAVAAYCAAGPCGAPGVRGPLMAFERELAAPARANTLGATLLHLTMPGVPDLYMGTELPYFALVDPDNRRPPRFAPDALAAPGAAEGAGAPAAGPGRGRWFGGGGARIGGRWFGGAGGGRGGRRAGGGRPGPGRRQRAGGGRPRGHRADGRPSRSHRAGERVGEGEAAGHHGRAAAASAPPGVVRRGRLLHPGRGGGPGRGALCGVRPRGLRDHRRHPAVAAAGRTGRLGRDRPAAAAGTLAGPAHRPGRGGPHPARRGLRRTAGGPAGPRGAVGGPSTVSDGGVRPGPPDPWR